jgi:hypothetical protein
MDRMVLRMNGETRIEDPRKYGSETVNDLRNLLIAGGPAQPDPHRENFYELENGGHTFYIHISPINDDVVLVAKWLNGRKEACTSSAHLAA